jgi:hypothetical protein
MFVVDICVPSESAPVVAATVVSALAAVMSVATALFVSLSAKWPDVAAFLETDRDSGTTDLVVRNFGRGVAYDVAVSGFDMRLVQDELKGSVARSFAVTGVPMLVPGAERRTALFENGWAARNAPAGGVEVVVSYRRRSLLGTRAAMSGTCVLDYSSFSGSLYTDSLAKRGVSALESIARSVGDE